MEEKTYNREEIFNRTLEYFNGDELATNVWIDKYCLKDSNNNFYEISPDDMHRRISKEIARIEKKYPNPISEEKIYDLIKNFKYIIPQGGSMAGIGNKYQVVSLSNCFVIGGKMDSYGSIMKVDQELVQLEKRRGGVGHDLSHIRPKGSPVLNSALTSTGIVPFMERYSNSTREVAQDGRRGALMLSVSIKHPDAERFIDAKLEEGKVTGANISIKIDDEFMNAVIENKPYTQQYPIDSATPTIVKKIDARKLWAKIIHNAWKSAEPGILFWDTILRESVPDCYSEFGYNTISTNPCGEIPLCPYDSCRLLALNLYSYVENPFTKEAFFNFKLFKEHSKYAQKIMDDIIDLELEKIDSILNKIEKDPEDDETKRTEKRMWVEIKKKGEDGRRTGVGITAEGDIIAALNLKYGSDEALELVEFVHKTLCIETYRSSVNLAKERGKFKFYNAELEKNNPFILRIKKSDPELYAEMVKYGRRNIALLTCAPTGTTSIMTQTTSGIEPVFMPIYKRRKKINPNDINTNITFKDEVGDCWEEYTVFHHKFADWLKINGYNIEEVKQYTSEKLNEIIKLSPYYKSTSNDINWVAKVEMQGRIQKWVDHSISVTINLPKDVKEEMVGMLYEKAWKCGCKGVTVYREGSRTGILVSQEETKAIIKENNATKRPKILECDVIRFNNNSEKWIAFIGLLKDDDGKNRPYEIFTGLAEDFIIPTFVTKGKINRVKDGEHSRYDFYYYDKQNLTIVMQGLNKSFNKEYWNYAKLISGLLRHGMPLVNLAELIESLKWETDLINTWKKGVLRIIKKYIEEGQKSSKKCPNCGECTLVYQEGCLVCTNCGHSKCS